jgi:hypothetical protein
MLQERKVVGYAASVVAEISSGQVVLVWFQHLGCQLVSNLHKQLLCYVQSIY